MWLRSVEQAGLPKRSSSTEVGGSKPCPDEHSLIIMLYQVINTPAQRPELKNGLLQTFHANGASLHVLVNRCTVACITPEHHTHTTATA